METKDINFEFNFNEKERLSNYNFSVKKVVKVNEHEDANHSRYNRNRTLNGECFLFKRSILDYQVESYSDAIWITRFKMFEVLSYGEKGNESINGTFSVIIEMTREFTGVSGGLSNPPKRDTLWIGLKTVQDGFRFIADFM